MSYNFKHHKGDGARGISMGALCRIVECVSRYLDMHHGMEGGKQTVPTSRPAGSFGTIPDSVSACFHALLRSSIAAVNFGLA